MDWMQILGSFGFPTVACMGLGFYVKYLTDNYRKDVNQMQAEHKEEIKEVTSALNNNTLALQKLCDKLDLDGKEV